VVSTLILVIYVIRYSANRGHLITHQYIQMGERPYACKVCNMTLIEKSNLIRDQTYLIGSVHIQVKYVIMHSVNGAF
jgi:hypothetical protein